jgi:uncharacterized protein YbaA (DUF1428 family)
MSFVEWPDKAARDAGMDRFTSNPRVQFDSEPPAFDGGRLIAAGFLQHVRLRKQPRCPTCKRQPNELQPS